MATEAKIIVEIDRLGQVRVRQTARNAAERLELARLSLHVGPGIGAVKIGADNFRVLAEVAAEDSPEAGR